MGQITTTADAIRSLATAFATALGEGWTTAPHERDAVTLTHTDGRNMTVTPLWDKTSDWKGEAPDRVAVRGHFPDSGLKLTSAEKRRTKMTAALTRSEESITAAMVRMAETYTALFEMVSAYNDAQATARAARSTLRAELVGMIPAGVETTRAPEVNVTQERICDEQSQRTVGTTNHQVALYFPKLNQYEARELMATFRRLRISKQQAAAEQVADVQGL
ncbi:hypothetical protein ACH4VR_29545 [Streptomyces sp. NPDC020883]|uniref:hypothetical protein n=1 Tax=Streptomyces sp. NPDC020883 TaxID=3365099 RepID=UPI00378D988E